MGHNLLLFEGCLFGHSFWSRVLGPNSLSNMDRGLFLVEGAVFLVKRSWPKFLVKHRPRSFFGRALLFFGSGPVFLVEGCFFWSRVLGPNSLSNMDRGLFLVEPCFFLVEPRFFLVEGCFFLVEGCFFWSRVLGPNSLSNMDRGLFLVEPCFFLVEPRFFWSRAGFFGRGLFFLVEGSWPKFLVKHGPRSFFGRAPAFFWSSPVFFWSRAGFFWSRAVFFWSRVLGPNSLSNMDRGLFLVEPCFFLVEPRFWSRLFFIAVSSFLKPSRNRVDKTQYPMIVHGSFVEHSPTINAALPCNISIPKHGFQSHCFFGQEPDDSGKRPSWRS